MLFEKRVDIIDSLAENKKVVTFFGFSSFLLAPYGVGYDGDGKLNQLRVEEFLDQLNAFENEQSVSFWLGISDK